MMKDRPDRGAVFFYLCFQCASLVLDLDRGRFFFFYNIYEEKRTEGLNMAFQYGYYQNPYSPGVFNAPTAPTQFPATNLPPVNAGAQGYVCRPVTSKSEAEVFQIPFDGSTTYFVDTSNGNIYSKTFDFQTGTAPVSTYVKEVVPPVKYATIDDLNALREELIKKGKAVKKNDTDEQ